MKTAVLLFVFSVTLRADAFSGPLSGETFYGTWVANGPSQAITGNAVTLSGTLHPVLESGQDPFGNPWSSYAASFRTDVQPGDAWLPANFIGFRIIWSVTASDFGGDVISMSTNSSFYDPYAIHLQGKGFSGGETPVLTGSIFYPVTNFGGLSFWMMGRGSTAFNLNPSLTIEAVTTTPEPSTWGMLAIATGILAWRKRRQ